MLRGLKAANSAGNGLIALFFAFGALMLFSWFAIALVAVGLVLVVGPIAVGLANSRQVRLQRVAAQARIDAHQRRMASSPAHYSNRR